MNSTIITMKNVSKQYGEKISVKQINLQLNKGEIVALCGGNGAGKSTLLRMLVSTILPSEGTIQINEKNWFEHRKAYASSIGYMPDDFQFSQALTAYETLFFWARLKGIQKSRVDEVLSEVGLTEFSHKLATSFSKGMKQRLMLAQALLAEPLLLIMDEPTNGLDPYWMQSFVQIVKQAKERGQTVIFSTHQLQIAEALADRVIFLDNGEIMLDGNINSLKEKHGHDGLNKLFAKVFGL